MNRFEKFWIRPNLPTDYKHLTYMSPTEIRCLNADNSVSHHMVIVEYPANNYEHSHDLNEWSKRIRVPVSQEEADKLWEPFPAIIPNTLNFEQGDLYAHYKIEYYECIVVFEMDAKCTWSPASYTYEIHPPHYSPADFYTGMRATCHNYSIWLTQVYARTFLGAE